MKQAYIINGVRTAIGNFGGTLSVIRTDDLAAFVLKELLQRNPGLDAGSIGDVIMGCANQAGEDNRNVARMASLLAGLPITVPGQTVNRLCASGMSATIDAMFRNACPVMRMIIPTVKSPLNLSGACAARQCWRLIWPISLN